MAWTYFPLSYATLPANGLQEFDIWQELIDAINERDLASGGTGYSNPFTNVTAAGTAIAQAAALNAMQAKIEALVPKFVVHTNSGGNWHGQSSIPIWAWTNDATNGILNAAHGNIGDGNGWTRRHGSDPDALSTSYGRVIAGDVVGLYRESSVDKISEFLNEMHKALNLLLWTFDNVTVPLDFVSSVLYTQTIGGATADAAWNNLLATWPPSPDTTVGNLLPARLSAITKNSAISFTARGRTAQAVYKTTGSISTAVQHSGDYYLRAIDEAFGEPIDEKDGDGLYSDPPNFSLIESYAESASASHTATSVVTDDVLQDRPSTNPTTNGEMISRGFQLKGGDAPNGVFVLKWDGPSGFTKVS